MLGVAALGACTAPPPRAATPAAATPSATSLPTGQRAIEITFKIEGGFVGRDESWIIRGDGRIQRSMGETSSTYTVAPERVAELLSAMQTAGFFDFDELYEASICADCFIYTITVADGQRLKRTKAVADNQLPEAVREVVSLLEQFTASLTSSS